MSTKISSMLDALANRLEAKGFMKEAYEIDKIADLIDAATPGGAATEDVNPKEIAQALQDAIKIIQQRQQTPGVVTAEDKTASGLAKSIALALLMGIGALAKAGEPADTLGINSVLNNASQNLAMIRATGDLPAPKLGNVSGLKIRIMTNTQNAAYGTINALDKGLAEKGMRIADRQQVLKPMLSHLGMLL